MRIMSYDVDTNQEFKRACPSLNSFSSYYKRADDSLSAKNAYILKKVLLVCYVFFRIREHVLESYKLKFQFSILKCDYSCDYVSFLSGQCNSSRCRTYCMKGSKPHFYSGK